MGVFWLRKTEYAFVMNFSFKIQLVGKVNQLTTKKENT